MASDGTTIAAFGVTVTKIGGGGSGTYRFTLTSPPVNMNNLIITALPIQPVNIPGIVGSIYRSFTFPSAPGAFDLITNDQTNSTADRGLYVAVYDLT